MERRNGSERGPFLRVRCEWSERDLALGLFWRSPKRFVMALAALSQHSGRR